MAIASMFGGVLRASFAANGAVGVVSRAAANLNIATGIAGAARDLDGNDGQGTERVLKRAAKMVLMGGLL